MALETTRIKCAACGIPFALDDEFMELRRGDGNQFFCPNGHSNIYKHKLDLEKEVDRLKKELKETQDKLMEAQIEIRRLKCEEMAKTL